MRFVPAYGYVEVQPLKAESALMSEDKNYIEMGTIMSLGEGIIKMSVGQTIWFDAWRSHCTPRDMVGNPATPDQKEHWVVQIFEDALPAFGYYEAD